MPSVIVDPAKVHEFKTSAGFHKWLARNHDKESEVWIKIHKVSSGLKSITPVEAIDAALCWGWIDAIRKGLDEKSYLQRYTPRGKKSAWSQINVQNVARLTAEGVMTEHGLKHVEAAKADGRWDRAYRIGMELPPDLKSAIDADPRARKMFEKLSAQNRFALTFRLLSLKTAAGRQRKIASFVEMLARGKTPHPQRSEN